MAESDLVFGIHAVNHLLDQSPERVTAAYLQKGRDDQRVQELLAKLQLCGCHVELADKSRMDKLAQGGRHQGVIVEARGSAALPEAALGELVSRAGDDLFLLILDSVQDPRNLGACLRVADGAGVTAVIAPKNRAAGLTISAKKVACGAAVPFIQVTNLARTLRSLKELGVWLVGTSDGAADSVYRVNLTGPLGVILGGEEKGMRRLTREACDALVSIPMHGHVSSLNVSVATGVVLYEALRQRG